MLALTDPKKNSTVMATSKALNSKHASKQDFLASLNRNSNISLGNSRFTATNSCELQNDLNIFNAVGDKR